MGNSLNHLNFEGLGPTKFPFWKMSDWCRTKNAKNQYFDYFRLVYLLLKTVHSKERSFSVFLMSSCFPLSACSCRTRALFVFWLSGLAYYVIQSSTYILWVRFFLLLFCWVLPRFYVYVCVCIFYSVCVFTDQSGLVCFSSNSTHLFPPTLLLSLALAFSPFLTQLMFVILILSTSQQCRNFF